MSPEGNVGCFKHLIDIYDWMILREEADAGTNFLNSRPLCDKLLYIVMYIVTCCKLKIVIKFDHLVARSSSWAFWACHHPNKSAPCKKLFMFLSNACTKSSCLHWVDYNCTYTNTKLKLKIIIKLDHCVVRRSSWVFWAPHRHIPLSHTIGQDW